MSGALDRAVFDDARSTLLRLAPHLHRVERDFARIAKAPTDAEAHRLAVALSGEVAEVRVFGALLASDEPVRRALEETVLASSAERALLAALRSRVEATPRLRRALAAVHPVSFGPPGAARWRAWKEALAALPDQPVWGSAPDRPVSLRALFIPQRYREELRASKPARAGRGEAKEPPVERDPRPRLLALLRETRERPEPVFVLGGPGLGKSSLATMLAGELALDPGLQPVLVRLRDVAPERPLLEEIRRVLSEGGRYGPPRPELAEVFARAPRLVLVLDGFDELIAAGRSDLGSFFLRLRALLHDGAVASAVCLGRDALLEPGDATLPDGAHVLTLLPFDRAQVVAWSARWSEATGAAFDGTRYMASASGGDALSALATQPLLLQLLARIALEDPAFVPRDEGLAQVFNRVITWCCQRHEELRSDLRASELRRFLRVLGYTALVTGREVVRLDDLQRALVNLGVTADPDRAESLATQTILAFSMRRAETPRRAWEFLHRSIGEYLAAEFLAASLAPMVERAADELGEERWRMSDADLRRHWIERFGPVGQWGRALEFFQTMGADFSAFLNGQPPARDAFSLFDERLRAVLDPLLDEADMESVVATARRWEKLPSRVRVWGMGNAIVVAAGDARAPRPIPLSRLHAEMIDEFARWRAADTWRLAGRIHFDRHSPLRTGCSQAELPHTDWTKGKWNGAPFSQSNLMHSFFDKACLSAALFEQCRLGNASFTRADAPLARWDWCDLSETDFTRADLTDSAFSYCDLRRADFRGADLRGATLAHCSLADARFHGANLSGAKGLPSAVARHVNADGIYVDPDAPAPTPPRRRPPR